MELAEPAGFTTTTSGRRLTSLRNGNLGRGTLSMRPAMATSGLVLLLLVLASTPARGQVLIGYLFGEKLASPTFNMGFEVGVNFGSLDGFEDPDRLNHPVFGLFADWRFSQNLHFGAAVLPITGRGADGLDPAVTGDPAFDDQIEGGTMKRSMGYVEIPLMLKWAPHRDRGFRAGAGTSLGIVTGANDRYSCVSPTGTHYTLERDIGGRLPGFDLGISAEVEWRFEFLSIAARYTQGVTDMREEGTADAIYTRALTGTGRIYLGKKPSK